jgi:hypothetical protein
MAPPGRGSGPTRILRALATVSAAIGAALLAGCHATLVRDPRASGQPGRPSATSGVVKYHNDGPESSLVTKRESAFKQMRESCRGPYRIIREGIRDDEGALVPIGSIDFQSHNEFAYIEFECLEQK